MSDRSPIIGSTTPLEDLFLDAIAFGTGRGAAHGIQSGPSDIDIAEARRLAAQARSGRDISSDPVDAPLGDIASTTKRRLARARERDISSVIGSESTARLFHEAYERLAPSFGYETRKASAVPWDDVPEPNRSLMIAVAGEVRAAIQREAVAGFADDLQKARDLVEEWAAYADDYFKEKWNLAGDLAALDAKITELRDE